ncbi:unnamed protein product [Bursaphelenchus xylophilus]|uniref:(pine wood nematode) hypothetical protein n=1 Tax=Bursaphelenchus xylophilus TaxID=6326 RepID=A0A1I7SL75_BURXY|nr:unnamed protein product [Bursaphelenchus xylophilus]CAG9129393.1 unnamed protein product [Bursaphelenchus xylophilus]
MGTTTRHTTTAFTTSSISTTFATTRTGSTSSTRRSSTISGTSTSRSTGTTSCNTGTSRGTTRATTSGGQCILFDIDKSRETFFPTATKTVYSPGESVQVFCLYGRVHSNGKTIMQFNCTSSGWDSTASVLTCADTASGAGTAVTNQNSHGATVSIGTAPPGCTGDCILFDIDPNIETYYPKPTKYLFSPGEQVMVACLYGNVHRNGKTLANYTCESGGSWDRTPATYGCSGSNLVSASTSASATCPALSVNLTNSLYPASNDTALSSRSAAGAIVVHVCNSGFVFSGTSSPIQIYLCQDDGSWTSTQTTDNCVAD